MLTPKQIEEMDKITGLTSTNVQRSRIDELRSLAASVPEKKTGLEKVASFTGGEELGQGLGQALANRKISENIGNVQEAQFDIQTQLLERIKERKAQGQDTSKLESALEDLGIEIGKTGAGAEQLLNQEDLTGKEVIGDVLQLGTTIAGAGVLPGATKAVTGATTLAKGAAQGAKTGAIAGGAFGASAGVSGGLQEDATAGEIIEKGVRGAAGGVITGAALGGIVGGVAGKARGTKLAQETKESDFALDLVSPKATEKVKMQALQEGRVTEQTLLRGGKALPSKRDIELADAVKGVVSSKKSPTQNINAIDSTLDEINTGLKAYVKKNKVPFNTKQLSTQLNKGRDELKLVFASDANAKKTYDAVVKEFMKHVKNKDTAGLFEARQRFDKIPAIKKLLDSQGLGENTRKEIVLTVRDMANKYAAKLLPKGNKFRDTLLRESKMIEALENIAEKNTGLIGVNKLQMLTKKYPIIATAIGTAGATLLGLKAVGVGGSIVGSSE